MSNGIFYQTPNCEPYFNMAFDECLFNCQTGSKAVFQPVLRLYSWQTPAITIGYNQDVAKAVDMPKIEKNLAVIRRITGGRAIYHTPDEITFSLVSDFGILPEGWHSLSRANQLISDTIVEILALAGIDAKWARQSDPDYKKNRTAFKKSCFDSHTKYEIITNSGKIVGGAQRRAGNCFIHQGSIKINGIADCPAIGQNGVNSTNNKNAFVYVYKKHTVESLSYLFKAVFSRNLGYDFAICEIPGKLLEEVTIFEKSLKEKVLPAGDVIKQQAV